MMRRSDSSDGGDGPRPPLTRSAAGDPASRVRSSGRRSRPRARAGRGSSSSSARAPLEPPQGEQPPPGGDDEQAARVIPDLGEDLVFVVLLRAEARTLASAECVSRGWRQLARDERLWEAACVREWASLGFSEQMLRRVVLSLGGFRRLHGLYIRALQRRRGWAGTRSKSRYLCFRPHSFKACLTLRLLRRR